MSFLAPLWLALAAAVAVPLMLHLMRRRVETRVEFPAARYLARAEQENIRRLKLRNLLLMLLRTLAVFFLALAAARPIGALLGAGHVPTAVAIVLDNSLSTSVVIDGTPLLNRLKAAARDVVDAATSSDRLWLVTVDGTVTGGTAGTLRNAVDRVDAFGGRGDLHAAFTRAAGLVLSSGLQARAVVLVTDGQATAWTGELSPGDTRVAVHAPATDPPPNRSVALADVRPARWTPRGAILVRAAGADSTTYRVALGGRTLARGVLRGNDEVMVRAEPAVRGWVAGTVELAPDELRGDDERYFAAWIGDAPAVTVHAAAGSFARSAIEALTQSERARAGNGVEVAPVDAAGRLPALLLAPSDPVRLGAANRALERLGVPWRLGEPRRDETVARGPELDGTAVRLRYPLRLEGAAPSETLAVASGEPWIVAGAGYVLVGSPLDPSATDLPIRAPFIPWLADVLAQRLGTQGTTLITAAPGARLRLPSGTTGLEGDDGAVTSTPSEGAAPGRAGVYFLRRGAERIGALVVNPEPGESQLERLDARELADRLGSGDRVVAPDVDRLRSAAFDVGTHRPLQATLLFLVLGCLTAEMVIVRRAEPQRRRRAA
ncbi:MAG TPA: BatA domain-containing protein [Gemmatimonadaceae bacterium]|nr:BatA domain-containing protein [Gemmatimonadaceae bacterium]